MTTSPALVWRFDSLGKDAIDKLLRSTEHTPEKQRGRDQRLYCAACAHPITRRQAAISVQGAHQHRFTNPHGITFHIGCYGEAAGCRQAGEATEEHTWFPAHAWRIAVCAECRIHLGWAFHTPDGRCFFGLIVDRLASRE